MLTDEERKLLRGKLLDIQRRLKDLHGVSGTALKNRKERMQLLDEMIEILDKLKEDKKKKNEYPTLNELQRRCNLIKESNNKR